MGRMSASRNDITSARRLRRSLTLPEGLLWQHLRNRPGGFKFRRQHPLGPYVLDFFCREAGLAVEVDGMAHEMGTNPERDQRRDAWLERQGIRTLRVTATDVLAQMEAVIRFILHTCAERSPPPRFARSPSPRNRGEEF
jgi:very-short-patch-repair endonuclease